MAVIGLGFGDEGKGATVDFLARRLARLTGQPPTIVRFNGGPQAAHRVVTEDGREHTFAQFGSGSFVAGASTLLGAGMLIDPFALAAEAAELARSGIADAGSRLRAAPDCVLVTPYHRLTNRIRELIRGGARHGSCGMGVGEARFDAADGAPTLRLSDLTDPQRTRTILHKIQQSKLRVCRELAARTIAAEPRTSEIEKEIETEIGLHAAADLNDYLAERLTVLAAEFPGLMDGDPALLLRNKERPVIYEGAQGALLHERHGFFPYTSVTDTGPSGAEQLAREAGRTRPTIIGVIRALPTRHGAGPFVTYNKTLTEQKPDAGNGFGRWQREFRVGWFDLVLLRYALAIVKPDGLAVTCLDQLRDLPEVPICHAYSVPAAVAQTSAGKGRFDTEELFITDGRLSDGSWRVTGLRLDMMTTPERQRQLSHALLAARPIYETLARNDRTDFADWLEAKLELPVLLSAQGPTAGDRRADPRFLACYSESGRESPPDPKHA